MTYAFNCRTRVIRVIPELKLEDETVLSGDPMKLGEEVAFSYTIQDPALGIQHYPNYVIAGSYLAVGVVGGTVATGSLESLQAKLEATKTKLESENEAQLQSLTREDLLGDMFHAGMLGYFAQYQALGHLAALSQSSHVQLATSAGTYGYVPKVTYFFGIPRSISPGGVEMDLDRVAIITNTDGKGQAAWKDFNFQLGALSSALEHAVPEQMFVTEENPGEAVSAVKALQKAASQGQRIYHITQANQTEALPNIRQNSLAMSEIRAALAAGREVIVHTDPISVPGWMGAGYVIFDPDTGAGAWKIGGGANGSFITEKGAENFVQLTSVMSLIWDVKAAYMEGLAQVLAPQILKKLGSILSRISLFSSLVSIIANIVDLTVSCGKEAAMAFGMAMSVLGVIGFALTLLAGTVPVVVFLAGFLVSRLIDYGINHIKEELKSSRLCG